MPYFDLPANTDCEVPSRWREGESGDFTAEREVVEDDAAGDVGEDRTAVLVDRKEQVASRVQCEASNVRSVRERKSVGFGARES